MEDINLKSIIEGMPNFTSQEMSSHKKSIPDFTSQEMSAHKPNLPTQDMSAHRKSLMSPEQYQSWKKDWIEKVTGAPNQITREKQRAIRESLIEAAKAGIVLKRGKTPKTIPKTVKAVLLPDSLIWISRENGGYFSF